MSGQLSSRIAIGLVAISFLAASTWILLRKSQTETPGQIVLRLAHDNLHVSVRRFYQEITREYESKHPGVRVEVIDVPGRVWMGWARTQLTGGMAPDIIKADSRTVDQELAVYYVPLSEAMAQPNPYNRGTTLEGVAWRDTFIDGLNNPQSFPPGLMEIYRVPFHGATSRLYYNKDLLRAATGLEELPQDMAGFLAACKLLRAYGEKKGAPIIPLISFDDTSRILFGSAIFEQQTQVVARKVLRRETISSNRADNVMGYLRGEWRPNSGAVAEVWPLMREIGLNCPPSIMNTVRDDAQFLFSQQRAAMLFSGSWDASYYLNNAKFKLGVCTLPIAAAEPAGEERRAYGPNSEQNGVVSGGNQFGLVATGQHQAQALDLLLFLTSQNVNERYAAMVQRVPVIVGAKIDPSIREFAPQTAGWPQGLSFEFMELGGGWVSRLIRTHLHYLISPQGSVESFVEKYTPAYDRALLLDTEFYLQSTRKNSQRSDSVIAAQAQLGLVGNAAAANKSARMLENQNLQEAEAMQLKWLLSLRDTGQVK